MDRDPSAGRQRQLGLCRPWRPVWKNVLGKQVFDGWHIEGIATFYYGSALAVTCSANGAPIGYWTGTPTGGLPFRCQQNGPLFLPSGTTPASVGSTAPSNLWYPFAASSFALPPVNSLGIGNAQPTMTYGPGVENIDLSLYKEFRVFGESKILQVKFEAFNALNHFNPNNPNTSLALNFVQRRQHQRQLWNHHQRGDPRASRSSLHPL